MSRPGTGRTLSAEAFRVTNSFAGGSLSPRCGQFARKACAPYLWVNDTRQRPRDPGRDTVSQKRSSKAETMEWQFQADDARLALSVRREFLAFLRESCTTTSDCEAALLVFGELIANVILHAPGPI